MCPLPLGGNVVEGMLGERVTTISDSRHSVSSGHSFRFVPFLFFFARFTGVVIHRSYMLCASIHDTGLAFHPSAFHFNIFHMPLTPVLRGSWSKFDPSPWG